MRPGRVSLAVITAVSIVVAASGCAAQSASSGVVTVTEGGWQSPEEDEVSAICVDQVTGNRLEDRDCRCIDPESTRWDPNAGSDCGQYADGRRNVSPLWYFVAARALMPAVGKRVSGGSFKAPASGRFAVGGHTRSGAAGAGGSSGKVFSGKAGGGRRR